MGEGFKLLDAYVEVHASGRGIAHRVSEDVRSESGHLDRAGARMGGGLLGGLRSSISAGAVGGLVGGVVTSVTSGLVSIVTSAVSSITSVVATVGQSMAETTINYNSLLQNADIGFTTMLGSGRKSKAFLDDLQQFAKSTPFEFTDLVTASQRLLAMGVASKSVIPYMTGIGDAVAGLGGGADLVNQVTLAIGQMTAKGKIGGDDLMQLTGAGIPALKILADSYHVTTSKMGEMISAGEVLSDKAVPILIKGLEKGTKSVRGFGGMMDKQSRTFTGALSNIQDGLTQTTAKAFKPFFDATSRGMQRFAGALSGKPAERFQKEVTKTIKPFAKEIEKWFAGIDLNKMFTGASKALKGLTKDLKPKDLKNFLEDVNDIAAKVVKVAPKIGKAFKELGPAAMTTAKQGVDFIGWLADMVDWFDKTEKAWLKWRKQFVKGMDGFFADADGFWNDMADGWDGFWADLGGSIAHGWEQIVGAFQHGGEQITGFFGALPTALAGIGVHMVEGLIQGIRDTWGNITSTLHDLAAGLPQPVRDALGIASPSKVFAQIGRWVGKGLHRGLLGSVDDIKDASRQLAEAVSDDKRWKDTKLGDKMVAGIRRSARRLVHLERKREDIRDDIQADKDRISDLKSQRSDYAAGVRDNLLSNAGPSSLFGDFMQAQRDKRQSIIDANKDAQATVMGAGTVTLNGNRYQPSWTTSVAPKLASVPKVSAHAALANVKRNLKKLLADTKKFSTALSKLAKMGIDPYTYDELVQAGVRGGGLETAEAMVKDPRLSRDIFSLERQVASAGRNLGTKTSNHRFNERIADARDELRADRRDYQGITVQMVVEARKIDEVDKLIRMVTHVKQTARKRKGKH